MHQSEVMRVAFILATRTRCTLIGYYKHPGFIFFCFSSKHELQKAFIDSAITGDQTCVCVWGGGVGGGELLLGACRP